MTDKPDRQDDGLRDFARRCQAYLDDAPADGRHSDAAGSNAYELIQEAIEHCTSPSRDAAEGAGGTCTYCDYPIKCPRCGRAPSAPKPAPDAMREALEPFRNETKQGWNHLFNYLGGASDGFSKKWSERLKALQSALAAPVPPADGAPIEHGHAVCNEAVAEVMTDLGFPSPAVAAEPDSVRDLIIEACDLLAERKHGNPARSAGHNARLALEAALRLLPVQPGAGEREADAAFELCAKLVESHAREMRNENLTAKPELFDALAALIRANCRQAPHSGDGGER